MQKLSIRDLSLSGKRLFVRVDFNVPVSDGKIQDDTRIVRTLETLHYALERGAGLVLASHLGRPKGKVEPAQSLRPVAGRLGELLGRPVQFAADCIGPEAERLASALRPGDVLLLENLRFHPEEEKNDEGFARRLAGLCDGLYVDDAFASSHRAHASVVGITRFVKRAAAGLLMESEITFLGNALEKPARPFTAVLGGAKVSDKIGVVENLMKIADTMLIGGAMAYTFLKARGLPVGASPFDESKIELAGRLLKEAQNGKVRLLLPVDHAVAPSLDEKVQLRVVDADKTPAGWKGLDIGPETVALFNKEITRARTIFWNGPLGIFEVEPFEWGTTAIIRTLSAVTGPEVTSIVGGGDTVAALDKTGLTRRITHVSTGGGASLEFLAGRQLPGIVALQDKGNRLVATS